VPIGLSPTGQHVDKPLAKSGNYELRITAGGAPLSGAEVMLYFEYPSARRDYATVKTNKKGVVTFAVPAQAQLTYVEPIPYAAYWIMLTQAPASHGKIDCLPIARAGAGGSGWWHDVMGIDTTDRSRGAGIKVGVIDTGCGPHRNLAHVTLAGAFVDGEKLPARRARDVAEHGTHTTGIVGARPTVPGDYAGIAPGCHLFHARVFKSERPRGSPTQADIINAIDALSRDHQCDLINMSLGGGPPSEAEEDAIRDAGERGTLCICSAGNSNDAINYPAAYPECAAVSAIGMVGRAPDGTFSASNRPEEAEKRGERGLFLASFSCFGPTLACAAPGVGIVSTVPDRHGTTGAYMEMDGTSMASPAACGALAAILSRDETYKALPRDASRCKAAAFALAQHCKPFGLPVKFEGRGLPTV